MDGHKDAWGKKSSLEIGFLSPLLCRPRRPKKREKDNNPIKGSLQTTRVGGQRRAMATGPCQTS